MRDREGEHARINQGSNRARRDTEQQQFAHLEGTSEAFDKLARLESLPVPASQLLPQLLVHLLHSGFWGVFRGPKHQTPSPKRQTPHPTP